MGSSKNESLRTLAASPEELVILDRRGEEIIGYAMVALMDSFSRWRARQKIKSFGLSTATSIALLQYIEEDTALRAELAERLLGRAKIGGIGCLLACGLIFVPSIPNIYVGVIAVGGVYCVFSLIGWLRYSKIIWK